MFFRKRDLKAFMKFNILLAYHSLEVTSSRKPRCETCPGTSVNVVISSVYIHHPPPHSIYISLTFNNGILSGNFLVNNFRLLQITNAWIYPVFHFSKMLCSVMFYNCSFFFCRVCTSPHTYSKIMVKYNRSVSLTYKIN